MALNMIVRYLATPSHPKKMGLDWTFQIKKSE
jgi:hypothetical protein